MAISKSAKIEAEIEKVKEALKGTDSDMIKAATEGLSKKFSDLAGKIYQQQGAGDPNAQANGAQNADNASSDGASDADYDVH